MGIIQAFTTHHLTKRQKQVVHYRLVPGAFSYSPGMHAFAL